MERIILDLNEQVIKNHTLRLMNDFDNKDKEEAFDYLRYYEDLLECANEFIDLFIFDKLQTVSFRYENYKDEIEITHFNELEYDLFKIVLQGVNLAVLEYIEKNEIEVCNV